MAVPANTLKEKGNVLEISFKSKEERGLGEDDESGGDEIVSEGKEPPLAVRYVVLKNSLITDK